MYKYRAVQESDDFDSIYKLINETMERFSGTDSIAYGETAKQLKKNYNDPMSPNKGFVAIVEDKIVAFMAVFTAEITNNAYIECGFLLEHEETLNELLRRCVTTVRNNGGTRIYTYSPILFGQVRNKCITLWEKLGFVSEGYSNATTTLNLDHWTIPHSFDSSGIEPAMEMSYDQIKHILLEDGEDAMAELFQNQYSPSRNMNQVILTLKDNTSNHTAAIAYYRVSLFKQDKKNERFEASAFGIHVRPQYSLNQEEIKRFIQGALVSMKQLEVKSVISRITLKNFDIFAAMIKEGFHNQGLENVSTIRLYKEI